MSLIGNDIVVTNESGERLQANITSDRWPLIPGVGPDFQGAVQGKPGDTGWGFWNAEEGGMRVRVEYPGHETQEIITTAPQRLRVVLKRDVAPIIGVRPWHRDGLNLKDDTGALVKVRGITAFDAFRLFCVGDFAALETYAAWTRSLGADVWRVFMMWRNTGLTSTPATRAQIRPFVAWCHAHWIRPWLVGFCDQTSDSPILLSASEQDAHWAAVRDALDDRSIGEVVNEAWKNGGNDFAARFNLSGIPLAMRSTPQDGEDPRICGAIHTLTNDHTPRDAEWARKFKVLLETGRMGSSPEGAPPIEPTGVPALAGEPRRLNEVTAQDAADYYAGCELYGEGGILHDGADLQYCRIPANQNVYKAAAASWGVIPAHLAARGTYSRDDHNQVIAAPGALRNYAMIDGSTAWAVCPGGDINAAVGVNGWSNAERLGFEGRIVRLVKG